MISVLRLLLLQKISNFRNIALHKNLSILHINGTICIFKFFKPMCHPQCSNLSIICHWIFNCLYHSHLYYFVVLVLQGITYTLKTKLLANKLLLLSKLYFAIHIILQFIMHEQHIFPVHIRTCLFQFVM